MRRAAAGVLTAGLSVEHTWQPFASAVCFLPPSARSHSSRSPPLAPDISSVPAARQTPYRTTCSTVPGLCASTDQQERRSQQGDAR